MVYFPGEYYDVYCAELRWKEDGRVYDVPVFNHLHNDPQFGFPHNHYHIDGRFEMHPRMRHQLNLTDGETLTVIVTHNEGSLFQFKSLVSRRLKCERVQTGLLFSKQPNEQQAENLKKYDEW